MPLVMDNPEQGIFCCKYNIMLCVTTIPKGSKPQARLKQVERLPAKR